NGNCRFVSNNECTNGSFYQGILCSNPDLGTNCKSSTQTKCNNGNVYFIDSCGNLANVYDSSKVNDSDYWKTASQENCTVDSSNPDSIRKCGSCSSAQNLECSQANKSQTIYGNYFCKSLS